MANIVNMITGEVYAKCGHITDGVCRDCYMRMYHQKEREIARLKNQLDKGAR